MRNDHISYELAGSDLGYKEEAFEILADIPDYKGINMLQEKDITTELWREYDFSGRIYRIENPAKLFYRDGGTTHRVVDLEGIAHCVPIPGQFGCVLRWQNKDLSNPVEF